MEHVTKSYNSIIRYGVTQAIRDTNEAHIQLGSVALTITFANEPLMRTTKERVIAPLISRNGFGKNLSLIQTGDKKLTICSKNDIPNIAKYRKVHKNKGTVYGPKVKKEEV